MTAPSLLIAGCGDIGSRLATRLLPHGWAVHGLRRTVSELPAGVIGVQGDLFQPVKPAQWPSTTLDYVVYCATPSQRDEAGYRMAYVEGLRNVLNWLEQTGQQPKRLL
ncbi:NAD-dependent epimerase/dehydratase family protein, partial [Pseudomonas coronafaciens]